MNIQLGNIGKRYNAEWIFRNINLELATGDNYAILGANGSGKSTLLQVIAGNQLPSEGKINYARQGKAIGAENFFTHISYAAPYLELIEEFTLYETVHFHSRFKNLLCGPGEKKVTELCGLTHAAQKPLKYYSSGMKQRVRLALAILSDTPVLLLDEPCSNLDRNGVEWYNRLLAEYGSGRLIIVCSNMQKDEYGFCTKEIKVEDYKS